jgi:hypothetical protein
MRVGVIRGDVPSPIFLADLEPLSQTNWPTEPFGQTRYISRPNPTNLTYFLAGQYYSDTEDGTPTILLPIPAGQPGYGGVPAAVQSSSAISFPVTITLGSSDTLAVSNTNPAGSYTSAVIAAGSYATMSALITAINAALVPTGIANAVSDSTGTKVVIQSSIPGVGSIITLGPATDTSTLHLANGQTFTMPSAATIITDLNPVVIPPATGSINVSAANLLTVLGASPSTAQVANFVAPQFSETQTAVQSYQVGNLSKYLEATWNPNPRLLPAITSGPAIQVVENDGVTNFSASAIAPLPYLTAAVHNTPNTGDITITGVNIGNVEYNYPVQTDRSGTTVSVYAAAGTVPSGQAVPKVKLTQRLISFTNTGGTQGTVTNTSIVIPASLLNAPNGAGGTIALGVAGSTVDVKYQTFSAANYGTAATLASTATQSFIGSDGSIQNRVIVTITGLTNIQPSAVGQPITFTGAASFQNNGEFIIQSVLSTSSVTIINNVAVVPDANNGAISWTQDGTVLFPVA